ncbi:recombinase family protein [Escherichia coli]
MQQTITMLVDKGIDVVSLDLPVRNLSSAEGKLMLQMFSAFAESKNPASLNAQRGFGQARKEGKKLGRPVAADTLQRVQEARAKGLSQSKAALALNLISRLSNETGTSKRRKI